MKFPKLRELGEAIKALIKGPYTTKFPAKPAQIDPNFRGKVMYNEKICVGCGACAEVCPANAIDVTDDAKTKKRCIVHHYDMCIFCGQCHANCPPVDGIVLTNEYDMAFLGDRDKQITGVEKELALCECCGEVITTVDHLRFLSKKLGALSYSNPNLILVNQDEMGLIEVKYEKEEIPHQRANTMRVLCGKCRRKAALKEEWGEPK